MAEDNVLDLTAPPERQKVRLESGVFELRSMEEISFADQLKYFRRAAAIADLAPDLTTDNPNSKTLLKAISSIPEESIAAAGEINSDLASICLIAPDEIKAKLNDYQKAAIVRAVFTKPARTEPEPAVTRTSSQNSPASTEEVPASG